MSKESYIYLASPYSHENDLVENARYAAALEMLATLTRLGYVVFSPIVHSHPVARNYTLPGDWDFWKKFDEVFVGKAAEVWVLCLPGWDKSKGINAECQIAHAQGKPVKFIRFDSAEDFVITDQIEAERLAA